MLIIGILVVVGLVFWVICCKFYSGVNTSDLEDILYIGGSMISLGVFYHGYYFGYYDTYYTQWIF